MATPKTLLTVDAQARLTEFSSAFDQALATIDPENSFARDFGLVNSSRAIATTYPIPLSAAGYVKKSGDVKMRRLYERSLSMTPYEHEDGVEELAYKIEAPDFVGWSSEPARIAREGLRLPNKLVAAILKANPLLDLYVEKQPGGNTASTIRLFADDHPVNILDSSFGTFDNDQTAVEIGEAMVKACKNRFRTRKAPNGTPMGLQFTHLLVPAALEELAKDFFESDTLVLAVANAGGTIVGGVPRKNRFMGAVQPVIVPELLDDNIVYALDGNSGVFPWVLQDGGAPEEIVFDKTSDRYKTTGMVGVSYKLLMAVAAALPHAVERITLTG
jgi:hypothetical protein